MKQGTKLSKKRKIEIATAICEMYSTNKHTLADCCKENGVGSDTTFYSWVDEIGEIGEIYKKAKKEAQDNYDHTVREKARTALERKIEGYFVEEEETIVSENKEGEIVSSTTKKKKKYIAPSDTLIQVALYNKDSGNYKDRRNIELTGKDGEKFALTINID